MPRPRVVFVGTGGALNPERYQASILVQAAGTTFLLDVGGGLGVVRRLLTCDVDPLGVRHIVLSHRHLDHVGGLEPLLMYMFYAAHRAGAPPPPVSIHALPGSAAAIRTALAAADSSADRVSLLKSAFVAVDRDAASLPAEFVTTTRTATAAAIADEARTDSVYQAMVNRLTLRAQLALEPIELSASGWRGGRRRPAPPPRSTASPR